MASWGLYGDLPPPSTGGTTPATPSASSNGAEPETNPKLAKMMPTALRKKAVLMVPRSTHVQTPKTKAPKTSNTDIKSQVIDSLQTTDKTKDGLSLVSSAYAGDTSHPASEVVEEYDPARPNEYDKYLSERTPHKPNNASVNNSMDHGHEPSRDWESVREEKPKQFQQAIDLSISGEEAFNRRAMLSSKRPPSPPRPIYPEDDIDGEAMDTPPLASHPPAPSGGPRESIAARMMARMGWKEGSGLGKEEQGMTTALVHKKTTNKSGVIVNAPPTAAAKSAASVSAPRAPAARFPPSNNQSRVLLLKNMVGPGEVDDELEGETASECGKYGEVVRCLIYEVTGGIVDPTEAVRIFILFTRQEAAVKAYIDLNGRFFGGRTVNASFFNEDRFMANDLAPNEEEFASMSAQ